MNLQTRFTAHVKDQHLWTADDKVLIAISTGVDSMTLWHLCQTLPLTLRPKIVLAYVDHHLRAESKAETTFITQQAKSQQTPLFKADWPIAAHPKDGIEAAGRKFRYDFFYKVMTQTNCQYLLTAHHGDDLAETLLMKLTRSGDLQSTVGLKARRRFHEFQLLRPLLPFDKETIYAYAKAQQLSYFEDVTNRSDDYLRNRIRHHVLPQLKAENPQALAHMAYFSKSLNSLLALSQTWLPQLYQQQGVLTLPQGIKGSVVAFNQLPAQSRLAFLQSLWATYFPEQPIKASQLDKINALLIGPKPQVHVDLAGGLNFERQYQTYFIQKNHTLGVSKNPTFQLKLNHWQPLPDHTEIGLFETIPPMAAETGFLTRSVVLGPQDWPITVRHRHAGDKYLLANGHHGKLKKLFIDRYVPQNDRQNFWLVFANENLIWIPNFRSFQLFHSSETDKMKLVLCFKQRL